MPESFFVVVKTINERIYRIDISYNNCSLEMKIESFINYLVSYLPETENIVNNICRNDHGG